MPKLQPAAINTSHMEKVGGPLSEGFQSPCGTTVAVSAQNGRCVENRWRDDDVRGVQETFKAFLLQCRFQTVFFSMNTAPQNANITARKN